MGVKSRKTYNEQFKANAVRLAIESGKTVRQVARDLGIEPGTVHTWVRQSRKSSAQRSSESSGSETLQEEIQRLRRELARVTDERAFLKKATAYFAREKE